MTDRTASNFQLLDVFPIVWRHKKKAAFFAVATLALTVAAIYFWPRAYESEAKLFVRVGRENVTLDPTATTGQTMSIQSSREFEMQSVLEMLKSRSMVERVVYELGPESVLAEREGLGITKLIGSVRAQLSSLLTPSTEEGGGGAEEAAIDKLARSIDIEAPRGSAVVNISCRAINPNLARDIVATLVDVYVHEHARLNRTPGADQFFSAQADLVEEQLEQASQELRDAKNEHAIASVQGQLDWLETQKEEIEQERMRNARQLAESKARQQSLKEALDSMDTTLLTSRTEGRPNAAADSMRQQLYALEIKERELLAKYPETHPFVVAVQRQVENVRKIHEDESGTRSESTFAINPSYTELDLLAYQNRVSVAAYEALDQSLTEQYGVIVNDLKDLNDYAIRVGNLELKQELLAQSYRLYAEKLEQARIDAALQDEQITNVNVVQEATLIRKPVTPQKKVIAGLGLVIALFGGCCVALVAEQMDRRLNSPADVEAALSVPVLMSVPRSTRQRLKV